MSRQYIKARATSLMLLVRPYPYVFTLLYVALTQALNLVSMQVGGQPFVMDLDAAAAGDTANAVQFVPENITYKTSLILFVILFISVILHYGYLSYCLHATRGKPASFYDLIDGFIVFFRAVLIWLITSVLTYIGMLLLIVPGLIVTYTYAQAPRLLLDHPEWSALRCLRESRILMRGRLKEYFFLRLSLLGWNVLCLFPVTAVFAMPYSNLCETVFYQSLTGEITEPPAPGPDSDEKPPWEY